MNFWGIDIAGSHINWAKANLSPPFKFMSCTAFTRISPSKTTASRVSMAYPSSRT